MKSSIHRHPVVLAAAVGALLAIAACSSSDPSTATHREEAVQSTSEALQQDALARYTAQCAAEIGFAVPDFDCDDGTDVPVTLNGVPLEGSSIAVCDRPNHLNAQCDPGSRFQVLRDPSSPGYAAAHCRKKGNGPGEYGDIAVIQHNPMTGATCFFQSELKSGLDGRNVKSPGRGVAAWPWQGPSPNLAGDPCIKCHDNGPIIRSPYLTQIVGINQLPGAGDPTFNREDGKHLYRMVGTETANWQAYKVEIPQNTCNTCHRLGVSNQIGGGGTAREFTLRATGLSPIAADGNGDPMSWVHRMISGGSELATSAKAIADCGNAWSAGQSLPGGCTVKPYMQQPVFPNVLNIDPPTATIGDTVVITGGGSAVSSIAFGGAPAAFKCFQGTCQVTVPPGSGTVKVTAGNSATLTTGVFGYAVPRIDSMSKTSGPVSGGTMLNIFGAGFDPKAATSHQMHVYFGGVETDYLLCMSATWCTVRSPAGAAPGPVPVTVQIGDGQLAPNPPAFTYIATAALVSVYLYSDGTGSVVLNGAAPAGDTHVTLSSSNTSVANVPSSVTVPAGSTFVTYAWTHLPSPTSGTLTITATEVEDGSVATTPFTFFASPPIELTMPKSMFVIVDKYNEGYALGAEASATLRLALNVPPTFASLIHLTSSDPSAVAVNNFFARRGQIYSVAITNHYSGPPKSVTITATWGASSSSVTFDVPQLQVTPHCPVVKTCAKGSYFDGDACVCKPGKPKFGPNPPVDIPIGLN